MDQRFLMNVVFIEVIIVFIGVINICEGYKLPSISYTSQINHQSSYINDHSSHINVKNINPPLGWRFFRVAATYNGSLTYFIGYQESTSYMDVFVYTRDDEDEGIVDKEYSKIKKRIIYSLRIEKIEIDFKAGIIKIK